MLCLMKSKNIIHPQIFDEQSLQARAESHIIQFLSYSLWRRKYRLYTLFSLSNRMIYLHKRRKRIMDDDESMTKYGVSVLARDESHWLELMISPKN